MARRAFALSLIVICLACGSDSHVSYAGTSGVFVAWAEPGTDKHSAAAVGTYAGKRQAMRGDTDYLSGVALGVRAGVEIYKNNDGRIMAIDLASAHAPSPKQISNETAATIDDTCTLSGTAVAGARSDYQGVAFAADLEQPTHSAYFYRLPGDDGTCNTSDDVVHVVRTGMAKTDTPLVAPDMPVATARNANGGIAGHVFKSGQDLVLTDPALQNPIVLGSFASAIGVASALPVGTTQGYPTGQLYLVDGVIVFVDYAAHAMSLPLFTIPGWSATDDNALFAASPDTLYIAINKAKSGPVPASATVYAMPANGTAAPTKADSEPGRIVSIGFPVGGTHLVFAIVNGSGFQLRSLTGMAASTILSDSDTNNGNFIATAKAVYYTTWKSVPQSSTVTHTHTTSGIVGYDGTAITATVANSAFVQGGELAPWPDDATVTDTAYITLFQVQNLTPVTTTGSTQTFTEDGVAGGTLIAIDVASNQVVATLGTLPVSGAVNLTNSFRGTDHTGFLEATTPASTQNPATRDLYLLDSRTAGSLVRLTNNL